MLLTPSIYWLTIRWLYARNSRIATNNLAGLARGTGLPWLMITVLQCQVFHRLNRCATIDCIMSVIFKRTKILATVGPATHTPEGIKELIKAGANGLRINFSHGGEPDRLEQLAWIRQASKEIGKPVAILQDLQGPKIRLGLLKDNHLDVKTGDVLTLDSSVEEHDGGLVLPTQYNLAEKMKVGEPLLMFDGRVKSTVIEIASPTAIKVRIENDGYLMSRKGLNLPDTDFGGDIMTAKDNADLEWGSKQDFDYVALSFVQSANDIIDLRAKMDKLGYKAGIITKVETKSAIRPENLEEIVRVSDAVMVARGDLAVEAGAEIVPVVQRRIIALCRKHSKFGIVATQMLGSMMESPEPTRAEVSDIANAVYQGADVVMLSDETAVGKYPIEAVGAMRRTIMYTQENSEVMIVNKDETRRRTDAAISYAAVQLAHDINASAIVAETSGGATVKNIAAFRPRVPIFSVTDHQATAQGLALCYGTRSYICKEGGLDAAVKLAEELKKAGEFGEGPITLVFVSGHTPGKPGTTNNIQVRTL